MTDPSGKDIYLKGDELIPGEYHLVMQVVPNNQKAWAANKLFNNVENGRHFMTISGGHDDTVSEMWAHSGMAVKSGLDWGNDMANAKSSTFQIKLNLPANVSEDVMISRLIAGEQNFEANGAAGNTVGYDGIPEAFGGYNSNSFQSGLLGASGFTNLPDLHNAPGFGMPIPARLFQPPRSKAGGPASFTNSGDDPKQSHLCTGSRIGTNNPC
jgi:hypothetical protein